MEIAVEDLRHRPQRAEHQEDADKRRKVGDALEDGNEEQTADTDPEHDLALSLREVALVLLALAIVLDGHQLPLEMILEDESRENHGDKAGEEDLADHASGSDKTLVPQHDGRHVANRRERATRVGGNDDQRGVDDAVVLVGDKLAEDHDHDNTGGQVVKNRREDERQESNTPQELTLAARVHDALHPVEAAVLIDHLDDSHGSHQEEQSRRGTTEVALDDTADEVGDTFMAHRAVRKHLRHLMGDGGVEHKQCPTGHKHQQSHSGLVHFRHALKSYARITQDEDDDNRNS